MIIIRWCTSKFVVIITVMLAITTAAESQTYLNKEFLKKALRESMPPDAKCAVDGLDRLNALSKPHR